MNNTFNISRFGKILTKDLKEYYSKYGPSCLTLIGIYFGLWLINVIFSSSPMSGEDRIDNMLLIIAACILIAPFKLYGDANNTKKGITFAMLPASYLEKFASMLLNCAVITPILISAGVLILDTLLSFIGIKGGFEGTIFTSGALSWETAETIGMFIIFQAGLIYGNMLFKRHKVSSTILSLLAFHFLIVIVGVLIFSAFIDADLIDTIPGTYNIKSIIIEDNSVVVDGDAIPSELSRFIKSFVQVLFYLYVYGLPVIFWALTGIRIKNNQYK